MAKQLIIIDGKTAKNYRLGKNNMPMTTVRKRLFRTDNALFYGQLDSDDSILIYNLDSTQPFSDSDSDYLNPDMTMATIDIAKSSHKSKNGIVEQISAMDGMKFVYIAVAIIILLSVVGLI